MIEVEIEGIADVLEFPDGTADEVIQSVVTRMTKGRLASAGNAVMQGGGVGTGQTVSGFARFADLVGAQFAGMDPTGTGLATPDMEMSIMAESEQNRRNARTPAQREQEIQADPIYQAGQSLAAGAREAYQTNPRFAGEMFTDVLPSSAGQMVPTIAAGMVNPLLAMLQYGGAAGQDGAQEAIDAGRPELAQSTFFARAPIGVLTEGALGAGAGLRMLRAVAKAKGVLPAMGRGAFREGLQEGLEQVGGNLVASDVVGYDPDRPLGQGLLQAIAAGALLGGGVGTVAGLATRGPDLGPSQDEPPGPKLDLDPDANELPDVDAEVTGPAGAPSVTWDMLLESGLAETQDPTSVTSPLDEAVLSGRQVQNAGQVETEAALAATEDTDSVETLEDPVPAGAQPAAAPDPEVPAKVNRNPMPVDSLQDAIEKWDLGHRIFKELNDGESLGPVQSIEELQKTPPDLLYSLPPKPKRTGKPKPGVSAAVPGVETPAAVPAAAPAAVPVGSTPSTSEPADAPSAAWGQRALDKLDALDQGLKGNTYSDPLLLTPMARAAIQIAKVLVRGGMALQEAIVEAVRRAGQEVPGANVDADALAQALTLALGPDDAPQGADMARVDEHTMGVQRGERATINAKRIKLSDGEMSTIATAAEQVVASAGVEAAVMPRLVRETQSRVRATKANYPVSDGWAPIEVKKVTFENDRQGQPVPEIEYQTISYSFHRDPATGKDSKETHKTRVRTHARRAVKEVDALMERYKAGDPAAAVIVRQLGWYKNMADRLTLETGGFADFFSDLLGAYSPNTDVPTNWDYGIEGMRKFMAGDYNDLLKEFDAYLKAGGTPDQWRSEGRPMITRDNQRLFGMNSINGMKAMLDVWRNIEAGQAPKARNFALNLVRQSLAATIDVWAARFLQRMAGGQRIPVPAESGVQGTVPAKPTNDPYRTSGGAFGFGQEAMAEATKILRGRYPEVMGDMEPPDFQALVWFMEKELWTANSWTNKAGEGGSFEQSADQEGMGRYVAGLSQARPEFTPTASDQGEIAIPLQARLAKLPGVVAARVKDTLGYFMGEKERSFDLEVVADPDFDPTPLADEVIRIGREKNQDAVFVSRVLDSGEENLNARPGFEVYFKSVKSFEEALPTLQELVEDGMDGLTMVVDPRQSAQGDPDRFTGVRFQYIPEFAGDADWKSKAQEIRAKLTRLQAQAETIAGVSRSAVVYYDTLVVERSDHEQDSTSGGSGGVGRKDPWTRRAIHAAEARRTQVRPRNAGDVGQAAVPDGGPAGQDAGGEQSSVSQRILTKLEALDAALRSNTYSDPLLLTPMARAAIQIAKLLVRGGVAIEQAIRQAVAQARQQMPQAPDVDADLVAAMDRGLNTRQFVEQLADDPAIGDDLRSQVVNRLYVRNPNEDSLAFAGRILDAVGLEQGMLIFRDSANGLDGATRTMLAQLITRRLATAEREARQAGRIPEADEAASRAGAFLDEDVMPYSTDIAQALQAFSAFRFVSPAATIEWARRQIERGARRLRQEAGGATGAVVDSLEATTAGAVEVVVTSTPVQQEAGAAVDSRVEAEAAAPSGPVADAMRMEASNNIEMLPSMRRARTEARIRALQGVARASGYWQTIVNTSSRQLERRLAELLRGTGRGAQVDTVSALASRLTEVLGQQLDSVLGRGVTPANRTRPDHLLRLRQLLGNSERMSQIWRQVREAIAAEYPNDPRVAQVLASEFDVWSAPLLRRVIDQSLEAQDISIREMVQRNYQLRQGALGERLIQELGIDPAIAGRLVAAADAAYIEAMNRVRATIPARVQRLRRTPTLIRAFRTGLIEDAPTAEVDRALADAMTRHRVRLGQLVRRHYRQVDAQGRQLAEVLVQEAGIAGPVAERLASAVQAQFAAAANAARRREVERIIASGTPVTRPVRQAWQRLVEMSNLGALNDQAAWAAIQDRMDLPQWTPELARDVQRLADEIQTAAEGIPQQRAVQALLNRLARANLRWWDLPIAFWYANVLSGPFTQARNILGNATQLVANSLVSLRRPQDWPSQMAALGRGVAMGGRDAADVLRTGRVTGLRSLRAEASRPLELVSLPGRLDYMLTPWRLVGRSLAAADTLFFRGAAEQRAELLARQVARGEGLRGVALSRRVAEILGRTDAQQAESRRIALAEGLSGNALARRIGDLTDASRPAPLRENARQYGLRATFNQQPYGVMGAFARAMNELSNDIPPMRLIVPFTNVIANVVNEGLSWFPPTALGRSVWGHFRGRLDGQEIASDEDLYDQHAKVVLGTMLLVGLYAAAAAHEDDDDPAFSITSLGPKDSGKRNQLRMRGWIPHSVKIGDTYWSYANTPMAVPMAWLGNWFDSRRYAKLEERDLLTRLAYAVSNTGQVMLDQSFLDGLSRFLGGIQRDDPKASARMLEGFARSITGVVVPNAVRQVDRIFDPTVYDSPTMTAALVNSIPFVRRTGQPSLNVWGQPVQIGQSSSFASQVQEDPVLATLARRNLWISTPSVRTTVDGVALTPDEVYAYTAARGPRLREMLSLPAMIGAIETVPQEAAGRLLERAQRAAAVRGEMAVRADRKRAR